MRRKPPTSTSQPGEKAAPSQDLVADTVPLADSLLLCWGKTDSGDDSPGRFHPAVFHMLDVGFVARILLSTAASGRWRKVLGGVFGCEAEDLCDWLPYLIALHDIGKLSSNFQGAVPVQRLRLEQLGFAFGPQDSVHHSIVGQAFLEKSLADASPLALPSEWADVLTQTVGSHHGRFASQERTRDASLFLGNYEPKEWSMLRTEAAAVLQRLLVRSTPTSWPQPTNISGAVMALTGFTIICDWIGSDSAYFRPEPKETLARYMATAQVRARSALEAAGFMAPWASSVPTPFALLFPDKRPPRPLQSAIDAIPHNVLSGPVLAIIEAPTGEGKTEAALALAHRLAQLHGTDELYYALPTTATSNQMFLRLQDHLRTRLELPTQAKLVHGQAFLVEDDLRLQLSSDASQEDRQAVLDWFSPKKRALLASFGVGTVDQVELAVLNVKHAALRLIGLAGKVVIFDEVHAYDTYMTTIIEMLLRWLRALGTSVIILSATLPRLRREALVRAYGAPVERDKSDGDYPSLSVFSADHAYRASPPARQAHRHLSLQSVHMSDDKAGTKAKAHWLLRAVEEGGVACWMTNTVRRAQAIFKAVRALAESDVDCMLLHAQFPLEERLQRERDVVRKYGPGERNPRSRGVVVGTQVLEQSLDLDFDVMVSDLAPIDLVLQRAGRLQRHLRPRPSPHQVPRLWLNVPLTSAGAPCLEVDRWVYAPFLLLQTWAVLKERTELVLPRDYRRLVEAVYGFEQVPEDSPLQVEWRELKKQEAYAIAEARLRLLPEPDPDWSFVGRAARLQFDEDESGAAWIVAQTRLGEETVTAIPLILEDGFARPWPDGEPLPLALPANRDQQLALLRQQVRISHRGAVRALKSQRAGLPPLFTESLLLSGYLPVWLQDGRACLEGGQRTIILALDPDLGLVVSGAE